MKSRYALDPVGVALARGLARGALDGVGDPALGEWWDRLGAVHCRRRLSDAEVAEGDFTIIDIRGTPEADERLAAVRQWLPPDWKE